MDKIKRTRKEKIRILKNGLVEAWCCSNGLAPIQNVCLAYFLYCFNFLLPGSGTFLSSCCGTPIELKKKEPKPEDVVPIIQVEEIKKSDTVYSDENSE